MTPIEPIVEALVSRLNEDLLEAFTERAAILEFDASKPRDLAEALALLDVIRTYPAEAYVCLSRTGGSGVNT